MPKKMLFDDEARAALGRGVEALTRAVQCTLGPKGGNAIIDVPIGTPLVSRDGVSIAAEIELPDRFENMGAQVVREVSKKTNEVAGDGTTTATVLANALVQEGFKALAAGRSAFDLVNGMNAAAEAVVAALKAAATPVAKIDGAATAVAIIAANDEHTGRMVAEALESVGPTGIVTVDIGLTVETTLEVVEGASYERGYVSHHMVNDIDNMEAHLEDALVLLTNHPLRDADDVAKLRALSNEAGRPLLVIADEYATQAVAALLDTRAGHPIVAVHPPEYGKWRQAMLEDMAVMTGGRVFVKELGSHYRDATQADLGRARRVKVSANSTVISGGAGDAAQIRARMEQVRRQLAANEVLIEQDKFSERLAKLSGGIAVIHAGGATPVEQKRRAQMIEDALNATRAAVQEGVVPGGGTALIRTLPVIDEVVARLEGTAREGAEVLKRAVLRPLAVIARNSGVDPQGVIERVLGARGATGYNARTGELVDMLTAGVMDPVKVTYTALQNALSVASLILTAQTLIADLGDDEDPTAGPARGGGAEKYGMR
ncbi:MAG: chaperonin GroEL [Gammaproteobacteria bacterium]|nr:chaperonin GroEL [Gammaproteobacteria bacterium]